MSAKGERAARMARAANRGNRVSGGAFPILDAETLRLRLREYAEARANVEKGGREVEALRLHILRRARALEARGIPAIALLPDDWTVPVGWLRGSVDKPPFVHWME